MREQLDRMPSDDNTVDDKLVAEDDDTIATENTRRIYLMDRPPWVLYHPRTLSRTLRWTQHHNNSTLMAPQPR